MSFRENFQAWRYNAIPDHLIGEILTKRWIDNAIPFLALVVTLAVFGSIIPGFFNPFSLQESTRQLGEFAIVVIGLSVVMLGGGIDLSVGSIFALSAFSTVSVFFIFELPVWLAFVAAVATGIVFGAINGYLVGFLRLRAFLTTLVTFIIGRALYDILVVNFASQVQLSGAMSDVWDFIGADTIFGLSVPVLAAHRAGDHYPCRADAFAPRLAPAGGGRLQALGPQRRHPRAPHRLHELRLLRLLLGRGGLPLRRAPFRGRARHGLGHGDPGADGRRGRRQQPRRRTRLGRQGADGRRHRAGDDQRADQARLRHGHQSDGARHPACRRCDHRHSLAEEPAQGAQRGLCRAGLPEDGSGAVGGAGLGHALRAQQQAVGGRAYRARRARRARGRHSRPRRQSLLRHAPRRDHPLLRAGLSALGGVRPYRRVPAGAGDGQGRQPDNLRRRHGALRDLARPRR